MSRVKQGRKVMRAVVKKHREQARQLRHCKRFPQDHCGKLRTVERVEWVKSLDVKVAGDRV